MGLTSRKYSQTNTKHLSGILRKSKDKVLSDHNNPLFKIKDVNVETKIIKMPKEKENLGQYCVYL